MTTSSHLQMGQDSTASMSHTRQNSHQNQFQPKQFNTESTQAVSPPPFYPLPPPPDEEPVVVQLSAPPIAIPTQLYQDPASNLIQMTSFPSSSNDSTLNQAANNIIYPTFHPANPIHHNHNLSHTQAASMEPFRPSLPQELESNGVSSRTWGSAQADRSVLSKSQYGCEVETGQWWEEIA